MEQGPLCVAMGVVGAGAAGAPPLPLPPLPPPLPPPRPPRPPPPLPPLPPPAGVSALCIGRLRVGDLHHVGGLGISRISALHVGDFGTGRIGALRVGDFGIARSAPGSARSTHGAATLRSRRRYRIAGLQIDANQHVFRAVRNHERVGHGDPTWCIHGNFQVRFEICERNLNTGRLDPGFRGGRWSDLRVLSGGLLSGTRGQQYQTYDYQLKQAPETGNERMRITTTFHDYEITSGIDPKTGLAQTRGVDARADLGGELNIISGPTAFAPLLSTRRNFNGGRLFPISE